MKIDLPTPELPVADIANAQHYLRDKLGFQVEWHNEEGRIAAVSSVSRTMLPQH